jgi:mannose-6-phosphate isomerase-like protein (cupin superfamily)
MIELAGAGLSSPPGDDGVSWVEHFRTADLSVGTYVIPVGGSDPQDPHTEDEVYVVVSGRAVLTGQEEAIEVSPGSVVFVAAGEQHQFERVVEELVLIVVFGPAEGSRGPQPDP